MELNLAKRQISQFCIVTFVQQERWQFFIFIPICFKLDCFAFTLSSGRFLNDFICIFSLRCFCMHSVVNMKWVMKFRPLIIFCL
jgi:hypothetical protein